MSARCHSLFPFIALAQALIDPKRACAPHLPDGTCRVIRKGILSEKRVEYLEGIGFRWETDGDYNRIKQSFCSDERDHCREYRSCCGNKAQSHP